MAKQRATQHNGRKSSKGAFSAKHNDRNYDYEQAENIYADKTDMNSYWNCYDGSYRHKDKDDKLTFEETEKRYYEENFKAQWSATNQRYIEQRHKEKCKSFEDWSKMDCNLPEEVYLQVGDKENPCDKATFVMVANLYLKRLNSWNNQHGKPFHILDMAFHFDEAVPQLHIRRVWSYTNDDNIKCIGQEKALEQAGVQLPKQGLKKGRYNNRKMTFDKMAREMYLDCCKECGLDIETEALKGVRHNMTKDETINAKLARQQHDLEADKEAFEVYKQDTSEKLKKQQNEASNVLNDCKRLHQGLKGFEGYKLQSYNEKKLAQLDSKLSLAYDVANSSQDSKDSQISL